VSDSSRSRLSGEDGALASSSGSSGPGPGPRNTGPSPSSTTPIIPSSKSGISSHSSTPGPSVADLLSKLRASQSLERPAPIITTNGAVGGERGDRTLERERRSIPPPNHTPNALPVPVPVPVPQSVSTNAFHQPQQQDFRTLSFHQALPHISELMEDPHVVENLMRVINISLIYMISVSLLRFLQDERRARQIRETVVGREGSYTEKPRGEGESR
jgi:hypothetical protein